MRPKSKVQPKPKHFLMLATKTDQEMQGLGQTKIPQKQIKAKLPHRRASVKTRRSTENLVLRHHPKTRVQPLVQVTSLSTTPLLKKAAPNQTDVVIQDKGGNAGNQNSPRSVNKIVGNPNSQYVQSNASSRPDSPQVQNSPFNQPQPVPPDIVDLNVKTYHELARSREVQNQQLRCVGITRTRERSNSPSQRSLVDQGRQPSDPPESESQLGGGQSSLGIDGAQTNAGAEYCQSQQHS